MNRALVVTFILAAGAAGLFAETAKSNATIDALLDPLTEDMNALIGSIGSDMAPELLPMALSGDIAGEAAFAGNFPHGTFYIPSVGITLGHGFATALSSGNYDWKFMLDMPTLIQSSLSSLGTTGSDLYSATQNVFPYPAVQAGIGFGLVKDVELLANGIYVPQVLTDTLVNAANTTTLTALDPQFSTASVELKLRKVFFRDKGAYPAMSLALGGAYGDTKLGANIDLAKLLNKTGVDLSGIGTLNLSGPLNFDAQVYGAGLDFAISKRLPLFTPFASAGLWYRHAVVSSVVDLTATISDSSGNQLATKEISISPTTTDDAIAARLGAGFELRLWAVILHFGANLDLENPIVNITSFTLTGIETNGLSLNTGIRIAF